MRTTIDKAGRVVIPKQLRDRAGLHPGEVELSLDGGAVRIEPVAGEDLIERDGRWMIGSAGVPIGDDLVLALRNADQR